MAIFTTTSRRFDRKSDYSFGGSRNLRGRAKGSVELVSAERDRRDGSRVRGRSL